MKRNTQLFDVIPDPAQTTDLIDNPDFEDVVKDMKAGYEEYWKLVEPRIGTYTRIILGNPAEPETQLNSHDFHGRYLWNHAIVAEGKTGTGFIAIEFDKPGAYEFDLRRWPKEIAEETTLTTAPEGVVYDGIAVPVPLDIASARIKIWNGDKVYVDERKDAESGADGIPFTVSDLPKGPAFIQTWFYNSEGKPEGAVYYNYARKPNRTSGNKKEYYTIFYDGLHAVLTNGTLFELWISPDSVKPEARQSKRKGRAKGAK